MAPVDELLRAFLDSAEDLKKRIDDVEKALDRQGLTKMRPGLLVDKDFCNSEHQELVGQMRELFKEFTKGITFRLYASWVVLVLIMSGVGICLKTHDAYIHEIMKLVFK